MGSGKQTDTIFRNSVRALNKPQKHSDLFEKRGKGEAVWIELPPPPPIQC